MQTCRHLLMAFVPGVFTGAPGATEATRSACLSPLPSLWPQTPAPRVPQAASELTMLFPPAEFCAGLGRRLGGPAWIFRSQPL